MSFSHDAAEPTTGGGATLLPAGTYELVITKIEEKKTSKGFPMVNVTCEVLNSPEYNGAKVFHNVSFLPKTEKGAGMSSHFLKCINQPYQGDIQVDPAAWVGEDFKAKLIQEDFTYTKGDKSGQTKKVNSIKEVLASDDVAF